MKKLSIIAILVLMTASAVSAHDGSIGIYTSKLATDCDGDVPPFTPYDVYIMYFRSTSGPDGITAAEFRVEISAPATILISQTTWNPSILTNGSITTGVAVTFQGVTCYGPGQELIYLATLQLMDIAGTPAGWTLRILGDPRSTTGTGLNVAICDEFKTMAPVLGGWFVGEEGGCNIGAESRTWGAVKSLYNQ